MLTGKEFPGPSEACCNFIQNQKHVMGITKLSCLFQVFGRVEPHPAGPLNHRLQNQAGNLVPVVFKQIPKALDIRSVPWFVKTTGRGIGKKVPGKDPREKLMHAVYRIAYGHGAERVPMVSRANGHHPVFPGRPFACQY